MKKLIIANWKMNPNSPGRAMKLAKEIDKSVPRGVDVVIAPPFQFLLSISKVLKRARLAAQDAFWLSKGPYTGEVSSHQLKNVRVRYVIIGHSERRSLGETDEVINKKMSGAYKEGLVPVLCVGEPWSVRKKGMTAAKKFVRNQLKKDLGRKLKNVNLVVAYEPIWAIGSGKVDKPQDAGEMSRFIKSIVGDVRVLYGGSVTSKNIGGFMTQIGINGTLVGGASLSSKEFAKILKISSR